MPPAFNLMPPAPNWAVKRRLCGINARPSYREALEARESGFRGMKLEKKWERQCLELAQNGHASSSAECPLSRVKRTSLVRSLMSANDPKRTFVLHGSEHNRGHWPGFASASSTPDLVTPSISLAMSSSRRFHRWYQASKLSAVQPGTSASNLRQFSSASCVRPSWP